MNKNNKLTNLLLLILIVTVLVVGFFIVKNPKEKDVEVKDTQSLEVLDDSKKDNFDPKWDLLSKKELSETISREEDVYFEETVGLTLSEEMDLTGDSIPEAIILGNGWNNEVYFILIKDKENNITVAKQKNKDDEISTVSLISFGRAMLSEGYQFSPTDHGFYTISKSFNQKTESFKCDTEGVNFYLWNSQTKLFEWDSVLTKKYTAEVCK